MTFSIDVERITDNLGDNVETVARGIVKSLFHGVIFNTRVDTGRLRGNWQTSAGQPITTQIERLDQVPQGSAGGQAWEEVDRVVQGPGLYYCTNNLPYAAIWDERDGLVDREIARLQRAVEQEARRVRS